MKKILLTLTALTVVIMASAKDYAWGTAQWNIQDGTVFEGVDDLTQKGGLTLTFGNPNKYTFTFFQMLSVSYDLFIDDATEPIKTGASASRGSALIVVFDYDFVEGHDYRIVTTENRLMQANLATYTTDTISTNYDSYTISFTIKGPELVKIINVEADMSLAIIDQNEQLTFSPIDSDGILEALGIDGLGEAKVYGLNPNGSYNKAFTDPNFGYDVYDGWHDADGGFTVWSGGAGGGIYNLLGHNPYPAVYSIKFHEPYDQVEYFFYDYWKEYDPDEPGEIPGTGSGVKPMLAPLRAPETHYNSIIWDWEWIDDNGDPQVTQYRRNYRCDEGEDYKASFAVVANQKMVLINATMHFLSQEDYLAKLTTPGDVNGDGNVDLTDAIMIVYHSLGQEQEGFNEAAADVNADGNIDLTDAIIVVYKSLGAEE